MISKDLKAGIVKKFGSTAKDSGKPETQIAIMTARINDLTGHLENYKKDNSSRRGLIKLVSKRRKLLNYLAKNDITRYRTILSDLSLRK